MKFKEFIDEKYIDAKEELWFMLSGFIPLSDWVHRDNEVYEECVYRTTDVDSLSYLTKDKNTRKQIPTFKIGSYGIGMGARQKAQILLEMEGYVAVNLDNDSITMIDRNGKRWFNPKLDKNTFKEKMNKIILKKYPDIENFLKSERIIMMFVDKHKYFDTGKKKAEFIKFYYTEAKKLFSGKLMDEIKEEYDKLNKKFTFTNDELLLTKYKIKRAWVIKENNTYEEIEECKKELEKFKIKFCSITTVSDIRYIDVYKNKKIKCETGGMFWNLKNL